MNKTPTPHIAAKANDIAKTVIMPGDPLRAKFIAENFLENIKCFNTVRNVLGFTGTYKNKKNFCYGFRDGHAINRDLFI